MTGQLPESGAVFLDHVAHFVPAMDAAAEAMERCGFRLTPFTAQTNRVGGKTLPAGTGNRCAMFRRGYVEILAATVDTPLAQQLAERLTRHVGLHLAAFGTADAGLEHRRLAAAGFSVLPLVDMRRPVAIEGGEDWAHFTIARIGPGIMPEGRVQSLTHHTEDLVWRDPFLDHPNGVRALTALWVAAADPAEPARRFARFTGRPIRPEGAIPTIQLDRGTVRFATPGYLQSELGIEREPPLPYLAAYELETATLAQLAKLLDAAGVAHRAVRGGVTVSLPSSVGGTILFRGAAV
jgi:hypothetical protein